LCPSSGKELAAHLAERREALLRTWEKAVRDDPDLKTPDSLSVTHFRDLEDLARQLEEEAPPGAPVEPVPGSSSAAALPEVSAACRPPGEGIGLSIVKRLCELLEAGLEVSTEAGKGTTFQVSLPRRY
jgi:hypothetical protein